MAVLAMFPLGTVLLPGAYLPLHVFEPRYQALVQSCLAGDPEFGVVLITRGSEVGGGDVRTSVGTRARIVEAADLGGGHWALATVGTRRLRVRSWLADDPFPRAEVVDLPEPPGAPAVGAEALAALEVPLRRALAVRAELGEPAAPATFELDGDPELASFQAVALAPLGPSDRQALLEVAGAAERVARLTTLVREELGFLEQRLALASAHDPDSDELGG